jgi:hypothetical protein
MIAEVQDVTRYVSTGVNNLFETALFRSAVKTVVILITNKDDADYRFKV